MDLSLTLIAPHRNNLVVGQNEIVARVPFHVSERILKFAMFLSLPAFWTGVYLATVDDQDKAGLL